MKLSLFSELASLKWLTLIFYSVYFDKRRIEQSKLSIYFSSPDSFFNRWITSPAKSWVWNWERIFWVVFRGLVIVTPAYANAYTKILLNFLDFKFLLTVRTWPQSILTLGDIDVGDVRWRQNVLVADLRFYRPIKCIEKNHQHYEKGRQHNDSVTNILSRSR